MCCAAARMQTKVPTTFTACTRANRLGIQLHQWRGVDDPGRGHERVELPENLERANEERTNRRLVGNVDRQREPVDGVGDGVGANLVAVGNDDAIAVARQHFANGFADAARAADDDRSWSAMGGAVGVVSEHRCLYAGRCKKPSESQGIAATRPSAITSATRYGTMRPKAVSGSHLPMMHAA